MDTLEKNKEQPIIILGYGRSGTTWVSDIVSKTLGGLLLFEPFHPAVWDHSSALSYSWQWNPAFSEQIELTLQKGNKNPWLIRNHLAKNPQSLSVSYIQMIWDNTQILGFKAIRCNHIIPHLHNSISEKIVFLIRHPLAVLASILNRPQFFEEFGWDNHLKMFEENVLTHPMLSPKTRQKFQKTKTKNEKVLAMWAISNVIAISDTLQLGTKIMYYEDLYKNPFAETRSLLEYLQIKRSIHPSYIFTPSMLTLKTAHNMNSEDALFYTEGNRVFWKDQINLDEEIKMLAFVQDFILDYPKVVKRLNRYFS